MPPVPAGALGRRFRRLSADERRDFLAALWTARGYEATVADGGLVRAAADDHVVRIGVASVFSPPNAEADVVVGTRSLDRLRRRAERRDAAYVDPADLRDVLCFGVEREAGVRIAEEHLGLDPWVDPEEPTAGDGSPTMLRGAALAALLLAAATVLAVSGIGVPILDGGASGNGLAAFGEPESADEAGSGAVGADGRETETESAVGITPEPPEGYPPGLNGSGVRNASTVVETHRDRVEAQPRNLSVTYVGPAEDPLLAGVVRHEAAASIYTSERFLVSARSYDARDADAEPTYAADAWADGERVHRLTSGNATGGRYATRPLGKFSVADSYESFVGDRYRELLAADETTVGTSSASRNALVTVSGTGAPERLDANATEYRATAFLTPEGRIVRLTVSYVHAPTGETVRIEAGYRDVGDVPPPRAPEWIEEPRWE